MSDKSLRSEEHDWLDPVQNAVASDQYKVGHRRRHIVRVMRIVLLLAVFVILGVLFHALQDDDHVVTQRSGQKNPHERDISANKAADNAKGEIAMIKAKYSGLDEKQQPFNITADKASRSSDKPDTINLVQPMADILLQDGSWVVVYGQQGSYMEQHMQLFLNGHVKLFHDSGYEMVTDSLHIDLKKSIIRSDSDVTGHGPIGEIKAKGLEFIPSENKLIFTGPAKLILFLRTKNILTKQDKTP